MQKPFIAIDLGTNSIKCAVLDLEEMRLRHVFKMLFPSFKPGLPSGYREVEPAMVIRAVKTAIQRLLHNAPECKGLVMCSQMYGLVLTNAAGDPLANIITWQDERAREKHPNFGRTYFQEMAERTSPQERQILGNEFAVNRPLSALFHFANRPDAHGNTSALDGAIPASLPDFVLANLCRTTPTIDVTNAAAHGILNHQTMDWHHELIAGLRLDHLDWPKIRPIGAVAGFMEIDGKSLPCYMPIGDHQCALLGVHLREAELSINISTGSQVSLITNEFSLLDDIITRPYFEGRFLKTILHIPAGRSLNLLVRLLTEYSASTGADVSGIWNYIEGAVRQQNTTSLEADIAFFEGVFGNTGSSRNIQEDNFSIGDLFLAAFENMAENYEICAKKLSPDNAWEQIVFSGGLGLKFEILRNKISQRLAAKYRLPDAEEDSLNGLLILALVCAKKFNTTGDAIAVLRAMN